MVFNLITITTNYFLFLKLVSISCFSFSGKHLLPERGVLGEIRKTLCCLRKTLYCLINDTRCMLSLYTARTIVHRLNVVSLEPRNYMCYHP